MVFLSSFKYIYLWLPIIGFIIAFFASMTGGGGGFFFLPVLTFFFSVPAKIAVATSLAATLPVCLASSLGHYRKGNVNLKVGLIFAISGIIGALSGAAITNLMNSKQLKICFGIYSIIIALHMILTTRKKKKAELNGTCLPELKKMRKITRGSLYGFLSGIITGTFGTSGTAPVLTGLFDMRIPLKTVVGTSVLIVFVNTISALGGHILVGDIDMTLVVFLTMGTIIGAFVGSKTFAGVELEKAETNIRQWYAIAMIAFGIMMMIY